MLAGELHDFRGVPDDVVLANCLEPEGFDADAAGAHLRVPEEEPGSERLAVDFGPAGGIDEEAEHVLLATIEPRCPVETSRRRLEVAGNFVDHVQQLGVMQPGVAGGVDRAELTS